jgi:ribose-phosphate pyrophosphokinase
VPTDPLTSRPVFNRHFQRRNLSGTVVVAPDMGHAKSAARFAKGLGLPVAAGDKERISDTDVQINGLVGQPIQGFRRAIIYDDEISTGGSIDGISRVLIEQGLQEIWVACTHGVFVHGGLERLVAIPQITEIVVTDTVNIPPEKRHPKLTVLSVAPVFADAIARNYKRQSLSDLFVYGEES